MAPSGDEKILTYNDVVLRRSDLDILNGPHFINDRLIEFFFAHLSSSSSSPSTVLLVPPSISFFLANCPSPATRLSLTADLRLRDRDLILFTVNNNDDVNLAEGGSHWSLLAFDRLADEFVHLDSGRGINDHDAEKLYKAVRGLVGRCPLFVEGPTPRQRNGYDCGIHVMAAAKAICGWKEGGSEGKERWFPALREEAGKVPAMRGELLKLITDLMEKQRRSDEGRATEAQHGSDGAAEA